MAIKIIKPFKHIKTYNLKFTIDKDCMEVNGFEFSSQFKEEIDDLARCDLIADLVYLLEKDKTRSFNNWYEEIRPKNDDKPKT